MFSARVNAGPPAKLRASCSSELDIARLLQSVKVACGVVDFMFMLVLVDAYHHMRKIKHAHNCARLAA